MFSHLPATMAIAAAGAAMVSLVEHATETRAPQATAWLLVGSVASGLVALIVAMRSLQDYERKLALYRPIPTALALASASVLLVGWWRPAPWLLALTLVMLLSAVWFYANDRWLRLEDPGPAPLEGGFG